MMNIALLFLSALLFPGIISRTKSICSGRKGPGILQPLKDLWVLFRKGAIYSETTSAVFKMAPLVLLASVIAVLPLVPIGAGTPLLSFKADFVFFSYMLTLGKFLSIAAALDTGSSFEGMGANREALYAMLVEPAFFTLMGSLALLTGYTSFNDIFSHFFLEGNNLMIIFGIIGFYIILQVMMIETCRLPVDDPKTHLELTMIHEVMILDNAGFDKAIIHIATYLKFAVFSALIFSGLVPSTINIYVQMVAYLGVSAVLAIIIGVIESFRARNKMRNNPKYVLTLTAVALIAFVLILIITNKIGA